MKVLEIDYKDLKQDKKCLSILPYEFIDKYNCLIYCEYENGYVVLINNNFDYFNVSKLSFFIKEDLYLCYVKNDDWNFLIQNLRLNEERKKAVDKFKITTEIENKSLLNEETNNFYNIEINSAPIVRIVDSIIEEAISLRSSDIHIEPYEKILKIKYRIDGKLIEKAQLPIESLNEIVIRIKVLSSLDITKKYIPQDGKLIYDYKEEKFDIRVSIIPSIFGEKIALRILDLHSGVMALEDLNFSSNAIKNINKILNLNSGLVLVVGPTGSGKSTTLHAFLEKNVLRNENIITVEDPVEYRIDGITQVQVNEEAGLDFAACLRTILRQDPNIIMIGEIRDLETAKIACRASITGHLVYSTLHTNTSYGVINRLKDMNIENYLLVDALKAIISQRLVRCLCPKCKSKEKINKNDAKFFGLVEETYVYAAKGCGYCNMTGYNGRCGVYEVIIIDEDFRKLMIENNNSNKFYSLLRKKKFELMLDNGIELLLNGITSIEELKLIIN